MQVIEDEDGSWFQLREIGAEVEPGELPRLLGIFDAEHRHGGDCLRPLECMRQIMEEPGDILITLIDAEPDMLSAASQQRPRAGPARSA
jgi:hypothetical protein